MRFTHLTLLFIAALSTLGAIPLRGEAALAVFYCEVIPEKNETLIAVTEGTVNLVSRRGNAAVPVMENTVQVVRADGGFQKASELPDELNAQITVWRNILKFGRSLVESLQDFFGASQWNVSRIDLGGVQPGGAVQRKITLPAKALTRALVADFYIEQEFGDEEGVFLSSSLERESQPERAVSVVVEAQIADEANVKDGQPFEGKLVLQTSARTFNEKKYRMRVMFRASVPMSPEMRAAAARRKWLLIGASSLFGLAALVGLTLYLRTRTPSEPKARMLGKLTIVRDPTRGRSEIKVIDLQLASHVLKKKSIVLGSGEEADIRLPHESVKPAHCRIFPVNEGRGSKIFITPLDEHPIRIDQRAFEMGNYWLQNGSRIGIGEFAFEFEVNEVYRQVEVSTTSDEVQRGVITYAWDVKLPGFTIVPFVDKFSIIKPPSSYINFSDVKTIKFFKDGKRRRFSPLLSISKRSPRKAVVHFADGTTLVCYVPPRTKRKEKHLFALPIPEDKQTDYYLIVSRNIKEVKFF